MYILIGILFLAIGFKARESITYLFLSISSLLIKILISPMLYILIMIYFKFIRRE